MRRYRCPLFKKNEDNGEEESRSETSIVKECRQGEGTCYLWEEKDENVRRETIAHEVSVAEVRLAEFFDCADTF